MNADRLSAEMIRLARATYGSVNKLLVVSPVLQKKIKERLGIESEVLYDMVSDLFLSAPLVSRSNDKPFRFVSVGSLNKIKSFDDEIKSFSQIEDQKAELFIIGDGPEKAYLTGLINDLDLNSRVHLCGMKSKEEIVDFFSGCDAFVLASKSETFGVAYIEAIAMGLPVVATRCGGPESFMNEDCGLLVPVGDLRELTNAMNTIWRFRDRYDAEKMRTYIASRFSGQVVAENLQGIMLDMLN